MTPDEKLNLLLAHYYSTATRFISFGSLEKTFSGNEIRDSVELRQLVNKLSKDEFLSPEGLLKEENEFNEKITDAYFLTFDGERFVESGAYVQQTANEKNIQMENIRRNERMERNEVLLWVSGLLLAIVEVVTRWD